MQTMNVSLPDAMKHFIDAQVEAGATAAPLNMSVRLSATHSNARPRHG